MSAELTKQLLAISQHTNVETLQRIASDLARSLHQATSRSAMPDNYSVRLDGHEMTAGSRDFCIGYATAANEKSGGVYRVFCGDVDVWPDWGVGLDGSGREEP